MVDFVKCRDPKCPSIYSHGPRPHCHPVMHNSDCGIALGSTRASLRLVVTEEEIEAAMTPQGGWTREQLAKWGVKWPPRQGWKAALIAGDPQP